MNLIAIAKILNVCGTIVGVRLIDLETGQVKEVKESLLLSAIVSNKVYVANLGTTEKEYYSSVNKLAGIRNGKRTDIECPITILNKIDTEGYTICEYTGQIHHLSNDEAYYYAKHFGVSNARLNNTKKTLAKYRNEFGYMRMTDNIRGQIRQRKEVIDNVNVKLKLLGEGYTVTPDLSIEVIKKDVNTIRILSPIARIHDSAFDFCDNLHTIKFPPTFKYINGKMLRRIYRLRNIHVAKGSIVTNGGLPRYAQLIEE